MKCSSTNRPPRIHRVFEKASIGTFALAALGAASPALGDLSTNFNSSNGGFTSSLNTASFDGPWVYGANSGVGGSGGWSTAGQGANIGHSCTTDLTSSDMVVGANGSVSLSFDHRYSFENDGTRWDGGAVFLSVNGGAYTMVDIGAFSANGYSGAVTGWAQGSELGGLTVFSAESAGYGTGAFLTSTANLGTFTAGDVINIRFRAAFDSNTSAGCPSWSIDNVGVSNIVPAPGAMALLGLAMFKAGGRRRRA